MNQGRPLLSQDAPPERPVRDKEQDRLRMLHKKLLFASFSPQPFCEGQEEAFPDTVKVVMTSVELLDLRDEKHLKRYNALMESSRVRGAEVVANQEKLEGSWERLVYIEKRAFKALNSNQQAELDSELAEIEEAEKEELEERKDLVQDPPKENQDGTQSRTQT